MADEKHLHLNSSKEQLELPLPVPSSSPAPSTSLKRRLATPLLISLAIVGLVAQYGSSLSSLSNYVPTYHQHEQHASVRGYLRSLAGQTGGVGSCHHHSKGGKKPLTQKEAEDLFLEVPDRESAREASHSFTKLTHIAGTESDRLSALRVKSQWEELLGLEQSGEESNVYEAGSVESKEALEGGRKEKRGKHGKGKKGAWRKTKRAMRRALGRKEERGHRERKEEDKPRIWVDTYFPLLNYPVSHSLTLTPPGASEPSFIAKLAEDVIPEDPTSGQGPPTFHGFSKNGTAKGQLVYAGRATKKEIDELIEMGVDFKGKIVIAQYSGSFRGLKVQSAAAAGAVGILIYSDPAEDGEATIEKGLEPYPAGPARQPSSVQRGSVQFLSIYPGDPLTPFKPAYKNATRLPADSEDLNIPTIPSIPISYEDAIPLLKSLKGKGIKREDKEGFREGGLGYRGVEYWTGPGEEEVELTNVVDDKVTPIWNTYALIPGHLSDEIVIIGNHNDAWTFGAGDPNSGTAAVHEVVKGFGELRKQGWKPLRTILVASWDAEEYGLIGSTEFGEDFSALLKEKVVAYLNVDVAVSGTSYGINASPSLAHLFLNVSDAIIDPDQTNRSLLERLEEDSQVKEPHQAAQGAATAVGALGSGSDFTVFLQYLGIASSNVGYSRKRTDPVYHYHSSYDSAYWQDHFGDPTFARHEAIAKVLGLASLRLADSPVLPINVTAYSIELASYAAKLPGYVDALALTEAEKEKINLDLKKLDEVIARIQKGAATVDGEIKDVLSQLDTLSTATSGHHRRSKKEIAHLLLHVRSINRRLQSFEGTFIDEGGLPGRTWYRSLVVAPGRDAGYGATSFPAVTESLTLDKDVQAARREVRRLVKALKKTVEGLKR